MINSGSEIAFIVERVIIPMGQLSLLLFGCVGIYLVFKYRTLAFWWSASRKELFFVKVGFFGFVLLSGIGILLALLSSK